MIDSVAAEAVDHQPAHRAGPGGDRQASWPIPALAPFSSMSRTALLPTASVLGPAPGWV